MASPELSLIDFQATVRPAYYAAGFTAIMPRLAANTKSPATTGDGIRE